MLTIRLAQCGALVGPIAMLLACGCAGFNSPTDAELLRAMANGNGEEVEKQRLLQRDFEALDELHVDPDSLKDVKKQFLRLNANEREAILGYLQLQSQQGRPPSDRRDVTAANVADNAQASASRGDKREGSPPAAESDGKKPHATATVTDEPPPAAAPGSTTPQTTDKSASQHPGNTEPIKNLQPQGQKPSYVDLINKSRDLGQLPPRRPSKVQTFADEQNGVDSNVRQANYESGSYGPSTATGIPPYIAGPNHPLGTPPLSGRSNTAPASDIAHSGSVDQSSSPALAPIVTDWRESMKQTTRLLEKSVYYENNSQEETQLLDTKLRLLYAIGEQRDLAVQPIFQHSEEMKGFWSHMIWALSTQLESNEDLHPDDRAADTLSKLRIAERMLAKASNQLEVKAMTFCEKVESYGRFTEFNADVFEPNQLVLLYFEVENFVARKAKDGYETRLKGRYNIYDLAHKRVANREYPVTIEVCRNYRRDFFMRYVVPMPSHLEPGRYTLQLTLEDELGDKVGQGTIEFEIGVNGS